MWIHVSLISCGCLILQFIPRVRSHFEISQITWRSLHSSLLYSPLMTAAHLVSSYHNMVLAIWTTNFGMVLRVLVLSDDKSRQ